MIPLQPHVTHVMRSNFQGLGRVAFYSGSFEAAARLYMPEAQYSQRRNQWFGTSRHACKQQIQQHRTGGHHWKVANDLFQLRRARSIREKALGGSCPEFSDTELGLASQVQADALKVRRIIPKKIEK